MDIYSPSSEAYRKRQLAQKALKRDALIRKSAVIIAKGSLGVACVCAFIFTYIVWA